MTVTHASLSRLPEQIDLAVCQRNLAPLVHTQRPALPVFAVDFYTDDPVFDRLANILGAAQMPVSTATAPSADDTFCAIRLGLPACSSEQAITLAGQLLVDCGCVEQDYIASMLAREALLTTCVGLGVAMPHGTAEGRQFVHRRGAVLLQFPDGIDFGGQRVTLVFGLAAPEQQHIALIAAIADLLEDGERLAALNRCIKEQDARALLQLAE